MLHIANAFSGDFVKPYDVSIGCFGEYDQLTIIVVVGIITEIEVLNAVGVIILVKVSPTGIITVPEGTARILKILRHDQLISFGRRGVGFSFFFRILFLGGRGFVVFIKGYDVILTVSINICC